MKKTQTPISSSIGTHETKMFSSSDCSSSGRTLTWTPYFIRSLTIHRSFGALTVIGRPSLPRARSVRPSTTTLSMRPSLASDMNCEYGMSPPRACRVSNCLNTVNSTSAMTSQTAAFENALFTN